ncbi:tetratricopeptide repeat protein [Nitrosophilus kaiyonis]|uniref:tetratricopeptide repeat protein n=1 Tax=Nitrosophilus kaiyonis TaxID=2930200 RepID=UPI0024937B31|nr:tetratricopeptide repeat protein [Nitrosophilus kaiyonis]
MDNFLIEYRDPLFGILIFFILVFIVSFFSYWWAYYKRKEQESEISKFFSKFEENADEEILNIQKTDTKKAFLLLANAFEKSGDFEKAIAIYLNLSKLSKDSFEKEEILKRLGFIYFKIGFLEKSKEIFIKTLKFFPRDKESLKYLMVIYEKLQQYDKAIEILESLEELGIEKYESEYIKALYLVKNSTSDTDKLINIYNECNELVRVVFKYLFDYYPQIAWKNIKSKDLIYISDILWHLPFEKIDFKYVKKDQFLSELYSAKGYIDTKKSSKIFELNVLLNLKNDIADLDFEYLCNECKSIFPISFTRCPNCLSPKSPTVEFILTKKRAINEENISI